MRQMVRTNLSAKLNSYLFHEFIEAAGDAARGNTNNDKRVRRSISLIVREAIWYL